MARGRRKQRTRSKVAARRCIGCREQKPRAELLRIAAVEGKAVPDYRAALPGRGGWMCKREACARLVLKARGISRALKGKGREPAAEELVAWVLASRTSNAPTG